MIPPDLNPNIRKTVELLNAHGFATCDSGDGVTHECECDRDHGYVVIEVEPCCLVAETDRLKALLVGRGVKLGGYTAEDSPPNGVLIEANYSPIDGFAFIDVSYITDASFPKVLS